MFTVMQNRDSQGFKSHNMRTERKCGKSNVELSRARLPRIGFKIVFPFEATPLILVSGPRFCPAGKVPPLDDIIMGRTEVRYKEHYLPLREDVREQPQYYC